MKKCAILSMEDLTGFEVYDHLIEAPLKKAGWEVETVAWRSKQDWQQFDLVLIRSPWDYQLDTPKFLAVLESIENSGAKLENPLSVVRWNINKQYMQELEQAGVEILPTLWRRGIEESEIGSFFEHFDTQEIVIKPCISAGAYDTFRLNLEQAIAQKEMLIKTFSNRDCMVQGFAQNIIDEGEFSLFYFDGELSHSILKTPKANDFRVQEEYGGHLQLVEAEVSLKHCAEIVLQALKQKFAQVLLYVRLDFVRTQTGFSLIEAELIEPSLYFNLDADSAQRFVDAIERRNKVK
ncbi:ATP-grasp domain-containing protein [Aliikangiella sp. IMCC44653]